MYERDYIERQIELAARVLARLMGIAAAGRPQEALAVFDQAYQPILGVGAKLVATLTDAQLLVLLGAGGRPNPSRWAVLVELLTREADLYAELGQDAESDPRYQKALRLATGFPSGAGMLDPAVLADVADRLRAGELRPDVRLRVATVYEWLGRFADAEDMIWEALDAAPGDPDTLTAAGDFYERLGAHDDTDLEAGGLPRAEVEEGLAQLRAIDPGAVRSRSATAAGPADGSDAQVTPP